MVRFIQGIGFAFYSTASFTFIANISQAAHLGQSLSYFFLAPNLSLALVPVLGIFIINHFSFNLLFLVCLGLSLSSLFIAAKLKKRQIVPSEDPSIEDGSLFCWKALPPSIISSFIHIIWGALSDFFPLYAINQGITNPGFFFTAIAILLILGRALGGKILDLYSREIVILYCLTTPVISMGILAFSKTQPMFILVAMIWGAGHAFLISSLMAYTLERTGSLRCSSHRNVHSHLGFWTGPRADDHGYRHSVDKLSGNVFLFGSHQLHQPHLFLFFCEKKVST